MEEEEVEEEQARRCSTLSGDVAAQWEAAVSLSTSPTFVLYLHLPPVSIVLASLTARHSHSCIVTAVVVAVAEAEVYQHHQHLFCICRSATQNLSVAAVKICSHKLLFLLKGK